MGHSIKQSKQAAVRTLELSWPFSLHKEFGGVASGGVSAASLLLAQASEPFPLQRSMLICSVAAVRMRGHMQEPTDLVVSGSYLNKNP